MCPPGSLHDRIAKHWEFVRSYTIKDGHLFLSLMADGGIYEFEPRRRIETGGIKVVCRVQRPGQLRMHAGRRRQRHAESDVLPDRTRAGARRARQPDTPGIPGTRRQRGEI